MTATIEIEPALVPALKSLVGAGDEAHYRDGKLILPNTDQSVADGATARIKKRPQKWRGFVPRGHGRPRVGWLVRKAARMLSFT